MLNREEQRVHSVTLMAQDDYSPPGISYFNLHVTLTDVNDKPESVTIDGSTIPEEVEPGKHLFIIVFISKGQVVNRHINSFLKFLSRMYWFNYTLSVTFPLNLLRKSISNLEDNR